MDFTTALKATQTNVWFFIQQRAAWRDEWFSDLTLFRYEFCNTSHEFWHLSEAESNSTYNAFLLAWVSIFLHKSACKWHFIQSVKRGKHATCIVYRYNPSPVRRSSHLQPQHFPRRCQTVVHFWGHRAIFSFKSWGVKTGMSWLDTLFNLCLSPQEAPGLLTVFLFLRPALSLAFSSFSNS